MTLKKSSVNPTMFTFRQSLKSSALAPCILLFGALMFLVVLMGTMCLGSAYMDDSGFTVAASEQYKYLFFEMPDAFGLIIPMGMGLAGALTALNLFKFITSKKTVNVYYSLGIKRENMFLSRYSAGAVLLSLATVVPMLLMFIINIVYCGYSNELLTAFLFITLSLLATALVAFSVCAVVFGAVGTTFETVIFSVIILFTPTMVFYALEWLMSAFLYGNPYGVYFEFASDYSYDYRPETLVDKFAFLNPLLFNANDLALYSAMDKAGKTNPNLMGENEITGLPDFSAAIMWLVIAFAVMFLGVVVFKKRKAEICGFIGMNKPLNAFCVFVVSFLVACGTSTMDSLRNTLVGQLAAGAIAFSVVYIISELLILRDTKKFARGLVKLPIGLVLCGICIIIFNNGLFGFTEKMPDTSQIKEAAITFGGVNDEFAFSSGDKMYMSNTVSYASNGLIADGFVTEGDIERVLAVHKKIAETTDGDETNASVKIVYTMKDGSRFMRCFKNVPMSAYKELLGLEKSDNYKNRLYELFKGEIKSGDNLTDEQIQFSERQLAIRGSNLVKNYTVVYSTYFDNSAELNLDAAKKNKLANCLYTDLANRSIEEKYYPEETPLMYLEFNYYEGASGVYIEYDSETEEFENSQEIQYIDLTGVDTDVFRLSVYDNCLTFAVTSDMVNTISFLKELGIYEKMTEIPEYTKAEVVAVSDFEDYDNIFSENNLYFKKGNIFIYEDYYYSADDEGRWMGEKSQIVTDKASVQSLLALGYTAYQVDKTTGYYALLTNDETEDVICLYIPAEKMETSLLK